MFCLLTNISRVWNSKLCVVGFEATASDVKDDEKGGM